MDPIMPKFATEIIDYSKLVKKKELNDARNSAKKEISLINELKLNNKNSMTLMGIDIFKKNLAAINNQITLYNERKKRRNPLNGLSGIDFKEWNNSINHELWKINDLVFKIIYFIEIKDLNNVLLVNKFFNGLTPLLKGNPVINVLSKLKKIKLKDKDNFTIPILKIMINAHNVLIAESKSDVERFNIHVNEYKIIINKLPFHFKVMNEILALRITGYKWDDIVTQEILKKLRIDFSKAEVKEHLKVLFSDTNDENICSAINKLVLIGVETFRFERLMAASGL